MVESIKMNKCENISCQGNLSENFKTFEFSLINKPGCYYEEEVEIDICEKCILNAVKDRLQLPSVVYAFCWKADDYRGDVISLFYNKKDAEDMINSFGNCSDNYCVKEMEVTK